MKRKTTGSLYRTAMIWCDATAEKARKRGLCFLLEKGAAASTTCSETKTDPNYNLVPVTVLCLKHEPKLWAICLGT